jgi:hypothetical protein
LTLGSSGVISGTPTAAGSWIYTYPFRVYISVKDTAGSSTATAFTISDSPPQTTQDTLTVVNGSGSGSYSPNTTVSITANAAPTGQVFQSWTGATVANPLSPTTTLVMPSANTTVTATYTTAPPPQYTLTVVNGSGSGSYAANTTVSISANAAPAGQVFQSWTGATVANPSSPSTTLVMPSANTTVTATYVAVALPLAITTTALTNAVVGTPYSQTLAASGGTPPYTWALLSGGFPDGLSLSASGQITGTPTASGSWVYTYPFEMYIGVTDAAAHNTAQAFPMTVLPPPVTLYTLTVVNGSGGGSFASGTTVAISANAAPAGQVFLGWTGATVANPSSSTTTLIMPGANTTVTANYGTSTPPPTQYALTVVNGSGSGSYGAGATVAIAANAAPAGQVFLSWTGATVASPFSASTTLVMPAANTTVTATYTTSTSASIPQPVTSHPRLWLTPADLPRFTSWCVASNPVYQQGLVPLLNRAIADYNNQFFPGGVPNPNYPDFGDTQGYTGLISEQYALIFALSSLIDPSPSARIQYAQMARNLIMVPMNLAAQGALAGAPFRDPLFAVYNRANSTAEAWPLVVDWIYNATDATGQPILSAQDKATIRTVFLLWATECLNASTTGGDHPSPVGVINSTALLGNGSGDAYRMASNNYYLGHARLLTLMALAIDPVDDPPLNPTLPAAALGNTMRSYILDATGAWLYQEFAMLGDPATVRSAFGLPSTASVGLASGGLPPEGMLYGHSYSFILGQLLALKTAGFADPALSGPQAALANNAPVFDRFLHGMMASLVPAGQVFPGYTYMGPVYQMASYGDILRLWITPDFAQPFALLALLDQQNGDSSRLNAERWWVVNAVEGGSANLLNRIQNPWSYGVQDALLAFLLLDPTAPPATDPRPGFATAFYDAPQGRLVEHTDWSANANMFDFRCSWISINHQQADGNQFEFYRKGEWLTKGVANYDNNSYGLTTDYHNTLSLKNWCANGTPANLGWWEGPFWTEGSQWQLGSDAGDPTATVSTQPAYTYAFGDTTSLYNRPSPWTPANAALDILHASRSILWLKPDYVVVYDRASSQTSGLFKRSNLALTAVPTINGNLITTTTPGGQNLYITVLLPAVGTVTTTAIGNALNPMAELEPSTYRVVVEDPSLPTDTRFLQILQGADAAVGPTLATLVQSSSGNSMDGAIVGQTAVLFAVSGTGTFGGTTYAVPAGVNQHYVTGCAAGAYYAVTVTSTANGSTISIVPAVASNHQADSAGVLTFSY